MPNFSGISNRSFTGRILRLPLRMLPRNLDVRVVSGPLRGLRWRVGSATHGCWLGSYEYEKVRVVGSWLRAGMVAYDIGANAGYYTLLFARALGTRGRVYSFEPFAENVVNLLRHVQSNGMTNCCVVQVAVAATNSISGFKPGSGNSVGSLSSGEPQLRVPTVSIDQLVGDLGFPVPHLIKMDVEGAEADILNGARDTISRGKPIWFIALHGNEQKRRCQALLAEAGYEVFGLDGAPIPTPLEATSIDEIYAVHRDSPVHAPLTDGDTRGEG